jgi:hypothetical protein
VLHGLDAAADGWARSLAGRPVRRIQLPADAAGAELAGIATGDPEEGEWYASADVPTSPVAGALSGLGLEGLPPLSAVLLPDDPARVRGALLVQLRGAGSLEAAVHLEDRGDGRAAVVLASGLWRWAARPDGREAYRRVWSGVAGWLLADQAAGGADLRPTGWVIPRGQPVAWSVPADTVPRRLTVTSVDSVAAGAADSVVVDTAVAGGSLSTGVLPPGTYRYGVVSEAGDSLGGGRFDVAAATAEMVPASQEPVPEAGTGPDGFAVAVPGVPLRTRPWPYLLVIALLCGEWIGRRRSGLR